MRELIELLKQDLEALDTHYREVAGPGWIEDHNRLWNAVRRDIDTLAAVARLLSERHTDFCDKCRDGERESVSSRGVFANSGFAN
jgi:hypothetical protein